MTRRPHEKHTWRSLSKSVDGTVEIVGCSYRGCVETEVRRYGIGTFRRRPKSDPMATKGAKR